MPPDSFLGRVTRYSPRLRLDPAENRLTEVTAGVLEHVDGFAQRLVVTMLAFAIADMRMRVEVSLDGEADGIEQRVAELEALFGRVRASAGCGVQIRTQVGTSSGRFVDLEIRLRPDVMRHELDLICWVEVKHGAPVHGSQLEVYELDAPRNGLVLVVAPLQSMPDVPLHMPLIPWQRLADFVKTQCRRAQAGSGESFILDAYAAYLKEEELMDDALTPTHALALAHYHSAERLLSRLCQLADPEVERQWAGRDAQHSPRGKVKYEHGWWAAYPLQARGADEPAPAWRNSFLEWGLQRDGGRHEDARNTTAFVAGASMYDDNPVVVEQNAGWVSDLRESGFAVYKGRRQRVWDYLYPEQLLAETTVEGQARYLADWVQRTFERLTLTPPPF